MIITTKLIHLYGKSWPIKGHQINLVMLGEYKKFCVTYAHSTVLNASTYRNTMQRLYPCKYDQIKACLDVTGLVMGIWLSLRKKGDRIGTNMNLNLQNNIRDCEGQR